VEGAQLLVPEPRVDDAVDDGRRGIGVRGGVEPPNLATGQCVERYEGTAVAARVDDAPNHRRRAPERVVLLQAPANDRNGLRSRAWIGAGAGEAAAEGRDCGRGGRWNGGRRTARSRFAEGEEARARHHEDPAADDGRRVDATASCR